MDDFTTWTRALLGLFFGPQFAGRRVRLMVTRELLDQNFPALGGTGGYLRAVMKGPQCVSSDGFLLNKGLALLKQWQDPPQARPINYPAELDGAPPFLPYLCLLCLAWTEGGEGMAPNAYYERLSLLYPDHGLAGGHLGEWRPLWDGLQKWTEAMSSSLGVFSVECLGGHRHIGIPRSQVILTPNLVLKLPDLFCDLSLEPQTEIRPERLRQVILTNEARARAILGEMIFPEIQSCQSNVGTATLEILAEYLAEWDGSGVTPAEGGNASGGRIYLGLEYFQEQGNCRPVYILDRNTTTERLSLKRPEWRLGHHSDALLIVQTDAGESVDASLLVNHWPNGQRIEGQLQAQGQAHGGDVAYRLAPRSTRVFSGWDGHIILEKEGFPPEGDAYLLAGPADQQIWNVWMECHGEAAGVQHLHWQGVPADYSLYWIPLMQDLSDTALGAMPAGVGKKIPHPRALRMRSGTRCNSSAARRVYAEYDPPILVVCGPDSAELRVSGAEYQLVEGQAEVMELQRNSTLTRFYALTIHPSESVVIAELALSGISLGKVSFGVHRDGTEGEADLPAVFWDKLGSQTTDDGVYGLEVPSGQLTWEYVNSPSSAAYMQSASDPEAKATDLIDSLAQHAGRLRFSEFKRRAFKITGVEQWKLSEQTRMLHELGYLDVCSERRGIWTYIYPLQATIYPLPALVEGKFELILTGAASKAQRAAFLRKAQELRMEVQVHSYPAPYAMIPPRISFRTQSLDLVGKLASSSGMRFLNQAPAPCLAEWSASLEDWRKQQVHYPDEGPIPMQEYSPELFCFVPKFPAPTRLRRHVDPSTNLRWHCLSSTHPDRPREYAYVRDVSWGMWTIQKINGGDQGVPIAYEAATGRLILPARLTLPHLLGRAVASCSGHPPEELSSHPAYCDRDRRIQEDPADLPYSGRCLAYAQVPFSLANKLGELLHFKLVIISQPSHS